MAALRPVCVVAGLNAAAQGLAGVVVSVVALCVCFCALGAAPSAQDNDLSQYITYYLQGGECAAPDHHLYSDATTPTALRIWMTLSLFFSASMLVSSLALVTAVGRRWSDEKLQIALVSWLFINLFAALDDLILGYVFGRDYLAALESSSQQNNVGPLSLALVTLLAVRGVYIWFLNLAFIIYLFTGARALHRFLNQQVTGQDQQPIESWPTLDEFSKSKTLEREHCAPTALNSSIADRAENGGPYPDYSARGRWPTLNGQAQTVRESRLERQRSDARERRAKTTREHRGHHNQGFEGESKYYLKLQNETGSTRDYEEFPQGHRGSQQWELPKGPPQLRREVSNDSMTGQYRHKTPDPWGEKSIPPPPSPHQEQPVHIPPVDYMDPPSGPSPAPAPAASASASRGSGTLSLQEAILDRTLRLKKVPEELRKGF